MWKPRSDNEPECCFGADWELLASRLPKKGGKEGAPRHVMAGDLRVTTKVGKDPGNGIRNEEGGSFMEVTGVAVTTSKRNDVSSKLVAPPDPHHNMLLRSVDIAKECAIPNIYGCRKVNNGFRKDS
ncbi:hypothetical protein V6N13_092976 [Hibiscus sabdariffa]